MLSDRLALAFPVFVVVLLTALSFWLDAVVQTANPPDRTRRHDPDFIVHNFTASQTGPDGELKHTLRASRMTHYLDDDTSQLEQPVLVHFAEKGQQVSAQADRAQISGDGETIQLSDNVRLVRAPVASQSEMVLLTESLLVTPNRNFARTDEPVVIQNATSRTDAVGLEFDYRTRQLELLRDVRTTWKPPPRR